LNANHFYLDHRRTRLPHSAKSFYELYSGQSVESSAMLTRVEVWLKGVLAVAISGVGRNS
jgi:hypothetical protein